MESKLHTVEQVSGHTFDSIYDLIFTETRLIIVKILDPNDGRGKIMKSNLSSLFFGSGFSKRNVTIKRLDIADQKREQLKNLSIDEIISDKENCIISKYSDIVDADFSKSLLGRTINLIINNNGNKTDFTLRPSSTQFNEIQTFLKEKNS